MKDDKTLSSAKTLRYAGILLGIAFLVLGAMSLLLKTEDEASKESAIRFAELGLLGLTVMIMGLGLEGALKSLAYIETKSSNEFEDDDGGDILA